MERPTVAESAGVSDVGAEGVVAVLAGKARPRTIPPDSEDDALIPSVLGFADPGHPEECDRELDAAYHMGRQRGRRLGAMLRGMSADVPLDNC